MTSVHLVGSVGLDTVEEVFETAGKLLGPYLKRVPDGEVGGRRLWISWQAPLLRASPFLEVDTSDPQASFFFPLKLAEGVQPEAVRFGELGYAREARASYLDFLAARERGALPPHVRFQVSLPTPYAVIGPPRIKPEAVEHVLPAYERAMLREAERLCAAIPHEDLAIQWDVCIEMVQWDGRWQRKPFPGMDQVFGETFARLAAAVPPDVELGFHLCYGDLDAKHFIQPADATKMVELANLIAAYVKRPIAYVHMPVPVDRDDDAYYAPLTGLKLPPGTELYLGLVHTQDGVEGTRRRMAVARRYVPEFGIASECGISRGRDASVAMDYLRVYAGAAEAGASAR
ncbi:MAG TPA: hypothetical protein VK066_26830 [Chloroflexota bacterium]|nr:hypothetical protein [Chloroflexota bacterium]